MVIAWVLSLPALVVLLFVLALVDQMLVGLGKAGVLPWRRDARNRSVSATGFEVLHGNLSSGKAQELKERQSSLVVRDDEESAGRPNRAIDLDSGTVVFRTPR